jgi:Zn-finger nucleic acid-binding protein
MPLLLCPNCQSNMQALHRAGVEFDMCPTCRGVWLDRGELEKIIEGAREAAPPSAQSTAAAQHTTHRPPSRDAYGERGEQSEYGERGEYGEYGERGRTDQRRRKRGFDLFDIFD